MTIISFYFIFYFKRWSWLRDCLGSQRDSGDLLKVVSSVKDYGCF